MASEAEKTLLSDAKNFCESLGNVFMMKKRDPQTRHLLEQAKTLIEGKKLRLYHVHNLSCLMTKPTNDMCAQRRLRSAWASAQSDQSIRYALNG